MAKADNVSFLEQHVEKLVLVVCLVLLGWGVARWGASSPVALTVIGERGRGVRKGVPPEEVDTVLRQAAENILDGYDKSEQPVEPVPKWAGNVLALRMIAPQAREPVDTALPALPLKVEVITGAERRVRLAELEGLVPVPPKPAMAGFLELPRKASLADVLVARGMLVYPLAQLQAAWENRLRDAKMQVRVVADEVIVEVQEALPDGQWGQARRATTAVRPGPTGEPLVKPEIPDYDGKNVQAVREARNMLGQQTWQDYVLRPEYYPIWSGAGGWLDWRAHSPRVPQPPQPGQLLIWFHDDETMKLGGTYRYRVQLVLISPVLTYDDVVPKDSPDEARQRSIRAQWSEWSDPVHVDRQVHFFLTGASETTRQMTVTVYAQKWGQWVKQTFPVQPGELIGGKAKVTVVDPLGQKGDTRTVEVDFSTGAVSLRHDFRKALFMKGIKARTAELLYLDSNGQLRSRILALDERNELREKLEQEIRQATGRE